MAKKRSRLQENIFNTLNVGSLGMVGGGAFKSAGVLYMGSTGKALPKVARGKKPKFGNFKNLGV